MTERGWKDDDKITDEDKKFSTDAGYLVDYIKENCAEIGADTVRDACYKMLEAVEADGMFGCLLCQG